MLQLLIYHKDVLELYFVNNDIIKTFFLKNIKKILAIKNKLNKLY